jgi:hypothetical protein
MSSGSAWQPTTFLRFEEMLDTSMGTSRIVTDAGPAYIKALGNLQGPHPLACEWVATQLAAWFGLPTFEFALMNIDSTVDEIPFFRGGKAASGTAFVSRAESGHPWGGSRQELDYLANPEAVARLVVFDNWVLKLRSTSAGLSASQAQLRQRVSGRRQEPRRREIDAHRHGPYALFHLRTRPGR